MSSDPKHILNTPGSLVLDSLKGLVALNPSIALDEAQRVVYLPPDAAKPRVALLSGGGSGHEPAHAAFVGQGLLSAAVCGNIFASPNVGQIKRGLDLVVPAGQANKGALMVVKNYTGDALHFGLAAETFRSEGRGDVRVVLVGDDVSVGREQGSIVGRRGLAGTVLVYKIAAALAEQGADLDAVEAVASYVVSRLGTIGVGLDHCHVPGTKAGEAHLSANELELGMGIHNEPGASKLPVLPTADLVAEMLSKIVDTSDADRSFVPFKSDGQDEVVLLVNNLGSISELEMGGIVHEATCWLGKKGYNVKRVLAGTYVTSLNMPGFSLTLLLLPRKGDDNKAGYTSDQIVELLDAPANAPGWKWYSKAVPGVQRAQTEQTQAAHAEDVKLAPADAQAFLDAITRACKSIIEAEPELTKQDQIAGDGDAGLTLEAGGKGVLEAIASGKLSGQNVVQDIRVIAEVCDEVMGGTSGALYSIFFAGLGRALREQAVSGADKTSPEVWSKAAKEALTTLYKYTRARPPSRTLVDPLEAFVASLPNKGLSAACDEAQVAADKTKELVAKAGRGAYVNQEDLKKREVSDPGAWGIWRLVDGLRGYQAK